MDRSGGRAGQMSGTDRDAMTRSEEELDVQKRSKQTGVARLRKWVETEDANITVPVEKEKARVVTEPITDANRDRAQGGPDISEGEHEVVLREEEIDVSKRTVPKERVRLEKDTETEQRSVSEEVRKERVDVDREGRRKT